MTKKIFIALGFLGIYCSGLAATTNGVISIENETVRILFDLDKGIYRGVDKVTGMTVFRNATMGINSLQGDWSMSDATVIRRSAAVTDVADALGHGKMLRVVAEMKVSAHGMKGQVELALEIILHQGRSGIVLNVACVNRVENSGGQRKAVLVKGFSPLCKAEIFPEDVQRQEPLTLDGEASYGNNSVLPGVQRESQNNVLLTYRAGDARRSVVLGGLTYHEWVKNMVLTNGPGDKVLATMRAYDPVGRMVDACAEYRSRDSFYLDCGTADPFEALEEYARVVAIAQNTKPNLYNFPTVCMWFVACTGGERRRDTVAAVAQMDVIKGTGFLKYSPVAVRLVPDSSCYSGQTQNGWWDDAHWQKHGWYTEPYETSEKFCRAIRERGGLPFTYVQTDMPSDDFAEAHPDWMLFNSIKYLPLRHAHHMPFVRADYSDPGFQQHVRKAWANLGNAGLAGVMFDYPETGWAGEGGLEDPYSTTAAAYRKVFELAREGLGPEGHIHERNIGEFSSPTSHPDQRMPFTDITLGLVDSQRVEIDSSSFAAHQVRRCALRWYKARTLYLYDMDGKSLLFRVLHSQGVTEKDIDVVTRRRSILTMVYVTAGRFLLTDSFKDLTPEIIHDLSRIYPMHTERRSARPVDAFISSGKDCPRVYDFPVTREWHQVTFFNPDTTRKARISASLSGDSATRGALGLAAQAEYFVYDFWHDRFVGRLKGVDILEQELEPGEARMLSVRKVEANPQVLSTDRHLMQGFVDMPGRPVWDETKQSLSGTSRVVGGEPLHIVLALNGRRVVSTSAAGATAIVEAVLGDANRVRVTIDAVQNADVFWCVKFER